MTTRNERRKAAKVRLNAKLERIARAELGRQNDERRSILQANLSKPMERNYYPASNIGKLERSSHRGYVCRAGGSMGRGRALALKLKGSY